MKLLNKIPLFVCLLITGCSSCKKRKSLPEDINNTKPAVLSPLEEQQRIKVDNEFTLKLFKNLDIANTSGANLIVSPLSVGFDLGLVSNGSAGQTLDAFKSTMNFDGLTQQQVNGHFNGLINHLPHLDSNTKLDIANSIWFRQGIKVQQQFLQTDSNNFHAKVQALDFDSPSSVSTINNWVNKQTGRNIPSIVDHIPADAVMYLVNAIYFKSGWEEKFDTAETQKMPFFLTDDKTVQANFMGGDIHFNYYKDTKVTVFELPYSNSKFSMVIVMPVPGGAFAHSDLNPTNWQLWMTNLYERKNRLMMPKFKFSYSVDLKNALTDLGLGVIFSDSADFSLIDPGASVKISKILHKAYIETDEGGSTAAAVTSTSTIATAPAPKPPDVIDHPFIFAIREMSSGLIVFTGKVNNPLLTAN